MEVSRSNQSNSHWPTLQPHNCQIQATSVTYTTAHGNSRCLTQWVRPGIKPMSSWILVRIRFHWATMGSPRANILGLRVNNPGLIKCLQKEGTAQTNYLKWKGSVGVSYCGSAVMNPTSIHEDVGSLTQWVKDPALLWAVVRVTAAWILRCCGCGVGRQAAVALIQPLAWEPRYASSVALRSKINK